jgi:hypothetical protein
VYTFVLSWLTASRARRLCSMIVHVVASLGFFDQRKLPLACGSCSFPRTSIREPS